MIFYVTCESDYASDDGDGNDYNTGHKFFVSKTKVPYPDQTYDTEPGKVIVIVIYGDGCTYGYTTGLVKYLGPFTPDQANIVELAILKDDDGLSEKIGSLIPEKYFSAPWHGHFGILEETKQLTLE